MQISWRMKLIGLFTLILSVSLLVQVFYIIPLIQNREVREVEAHQTEIARNAGRELNIGLEKLTESLNVIANNTVFRNMDVANQTEVLFQYVNMSPDIENLFVMNETGWFVSGTGTNMSVFYTKSYAYKEYFIASFEQGENHFVKPRPYFNNTLISTSVSVPIKSYTEERVGVILGTMHLNDLIQRIADYPLNEDQVLFMVSKEGTVVAHSEVDLFTLEEGPLSLNYSSHYLVQEIMSGEVSGTREYDLNGTTYYGVNIIIESSGWGVIVETQNDKIRVESNLLVQNLWLFNITIFGIALVVTLIFTQQITSMQQQAEEDLRESEEALRKKEKLAVLGKLAGGVGHELRNPLGAIKNAVYFLNMAIKEPDEEVKESLKIIEEEVKTSERIITSLLDFARPKPLNLQNIVINDVVQSAQKYITVPENVTIVNNLDKNFPSINADPEQIAQVFGNIMLNAIQAMPDGGQLIINSVENQKRVIISFTDSGVGISEENLGKLFEPLFTTKAKGIGLGLAVSKTLIEAHNGSIEVQSKVGKGSTFIIKLHSI